MAFILRDTFFNPDDYQGPVVGIAACLDKHDSFEHQHICAQLLYAPQGCMTVTLEHQWLILPPTRAAWIPGGVRHRVQFHGVVDYRSVYVHPRANNRLPDQAQVFAINPLLSALIERIAFWPFDSANRCPQARHILRVLYDELIHAASTKMCLTVPQDPRLMTFVAALNERNILANLTDLAAQLHVHPKTLTRIFKKETGLSYQDWRQQWRLMRAIELLAMQHNVSQVADILEFSSNSAFIAFFSRYTGKTPKKFMR